MTEDLPAWLRIEAGMRTAQEQLIPLYLRQRGESQRGALLLKINKGKDEILLQTQRRNEDGALCFYAPLGEKSLSESEAESYVQQAAHYDSDLWIIELDSPTGKHPF